MPGPHCSIQPSSLKLATTCRVALKVRPVSRIAQATAMPAKTSKKAVGATTPRTSKKRDTQVRADGDDGQKQEERVQAEGRPAVETGAADEAPVESMEEDGGLVPLSEEPNVTVKTDEVKPEGREDVKDEAKGATGGNEGLQAEQAAEADHDHIGTEEAKPSGAAASSKRKAKAAPTEEPKASKAPRRSGRGATKASPTPKQLISYLVTSSSTDLCRPAEEARWLSENPAKADYLTYTSGPFSPFVELLCAAILSRPISHTLGHRSIRTLLNEPYRFRTAKEILDADEQTRHQVFWDAHTQHKEKTAVEMRVVAEATRDTLSGSAEDTSLGKVRSEAGGDARKLRELIRSAVKGIGPTGLDIFCRRVQAQWSEVYPFVDGRSAKALRAMGLPDDGEELKDLVESLWGDVKAIAEEQGVIVGGGGDGTQSTEKGPDHEDALKRAVFVRVVERCAGAELEGKAVQLVESAAKM